MVRREVLAKRLEQLNLSIEKINRYRHLTEEEFLADEIAQDVVEYNLFIAINMIVDMATHIVVDNNMGRPQKMADAFDILYREKLINKQQKDLLQKMVGFRNILSHEYIKIDKKIVFAIMKKHLEDFKSFILMVNENFMPKQEF
ncbi:MAG: type VII toxin-antitoxin system HepT family RNase toxin [Bacillota bacterium]